MSTAPIFAPQDRSQDLDQRVILGGIDWWQFEAFLAIRGDRAGVRVREVWIWKKDELEAYELRGGAYAEILQSVVIPGLSPSFIAGFLDCETQTEAVRKMRAALRQ
jgi:hypothetical protein